MYTGKHEETGVIHPLQFEVQIFSATVIQYKQITSIQTNKPEITLKSRKLKPLFFCLE